MAELSSIDEALATMTVPYEEWEVLYRQRLQVERDLRAGSMAGDAVVGAETPGMPATGPLAAITEVGRLVRSGVAAIADAATDKETVEALDKVAGPDWRVAVRLASVGVSAVQAAVSETSEEPEADRERDAGEALPPPAPEASMPSSAASPTGGEPRTDGVASQAGGSSGRVAAP